VGGISADVNIKKGREKRGKKRRNKEKTVKK
jgi:hypothetical protein